MFKKINIIKLFFEEPTREFNVREVARLLRIAPATASTKLNALVKAKFLKGRKERIINLFKADLESEEYKDLKSYYNIRKVKESGLLQALNKFYLKPTVVLFGSCAFGMDTETSDFDILIISERTHLLDVKQYEKKIKRKIQLFVYKDIHEIKNKHLMNNILNGMLVQGNLKWI